MRKFSASLLFLCALLAGCGNQGAPVSVPWQNSRLEIQAEVLTRPLDASFKLYINGERVIKDTTKVGAGTFQNFSGIWQGQRVLARFSRKQFVVTSATCIDVFINGNLVETLRL